MAEDKQNFQEWVSEQKDVKWRNAGLSIYLTYKDKPCMAILTRMNKDLIISAQIIPIKSLDDIGNGSGGAELIEFNY